MRILLRPRCEEVHPDEVPGRTAIAIDVIRATTTIPIALAAGCRGILPVATVEAAHAMARTLPGGPALLAGERGGLRIPGFDLGNSPREYSSETVGGKWLVFTTSNGTRTIDALRGSGQVAVASFVNVEAVSRWALAEGRDVLVVCSGENGKIALEDCACGGVIVERLEALAPGCVVFDPTAREAKLVAHKAVGNLQRFLEETKSGQHIIGLGLGADLEVCARLDSVPVVPRLSGGILTLGSRGDACH